LVSAFEQVAAAPFELELPGGVDTRRRGWLVRRALLAADVTALLLAFLLAHLIGNGSNGARLVEIAVFLLTIPVWIVAAKLYGLYERDEEHVAHSTVDELVGVFHLVTLGSWFYFIATAAAATANPDLIRLIAFWVVAVVLVTAARGIARAAARRS